MSKLISESFKMHANVAHRQKTDQTRSSAKEDDRGVKSRDKGVAGLKHVANRTRSTFA